MEQLFNIDFKNISNSKKEVLERKKTMNYF